LVLLGLWSFDVAAQPINPPLGPYLQPSAGDLAQAKNFSDADPVVLTTYFYWYDVFSGAHITNGDGSDALTDHPPTLTGFSYKLESWHRQQLEDMIAAGIDVLLPVYWGEPSQRISGQPIVNQPWSFSGLPPLVAAREALLAEGAQPPGIGMFYDTSTLQYNAAGQRVDLTTAAGRRWFYESIRDFFSLIPAKHWATIEGRPIIFLSPPVSQRHTIKVALTMCARNSRRISAAAIRPSCVKFPGTSPQTTPTRGAERCRCATTA